MVGLLVIRKEIGHGMIPHGLVVRRFKEIDSHSVMIEVVCKL